MSADAAAQPVAYPVDAPSTNSPHQPSETKATSRRSHSQGRSPWRTERRYTEIDDHTWKYTLDNEDSGGTVIGFGNVRIPSEDNIAKLVDRKLSIRSITWNINERPVKVLEHLVDHLEHISKSLLEDVIIIALQELPSSTTTFHEDALAIIIASLRNTHNTYISYRAWSQMIFVFIRREHIRFATDPVAKFVPATTLAKPVRTKGAIGVCMRLYQRWIVIIACHLTHANVIQRIQDYHKVMKTLKFPALCSFKGNDDIMHADCVLWLGDLNFRITEDSSVNWQTQLFKPNLRNIKSSLENDELGLVRQKELAFAEFNEAPIAFPPTHKFELGTNNYVPNRIPSFTDRVLFWTKQPNWIECTSYNCIQEATQSDHRPVYAIFRLEVINKKTPRRFNSDQNVADRTHKQTVSHNRSPLFKGNSSQI